MKIVNCFLALCLLLLSCENNNSRFFFENHAKCKEVDTINFFERTKNYWPAQKPNSISHAVKLLNGMANDNFKCGIILINEEDLYFNLGLKIRNDWVRHGTDRIRNQLFTKLKLKDVDYSSGLIIDIYRQVLTNQKIDLVSRYSKNKTDTTWQAINNELKNIEKELGF